VKNGLGPAGLPDGLSGDQKSQFGYIFEGIKCRYNLWPFLIFFGDWVYVLYCHLEYFWVIWYIHSSCFGMLCQEKSGSMAWDPEEGVNRTSARFPVSGS
jgi:hypothetical protein